MQLIWWKRFINSMFVQDIDHPIRCWRRCHPSFNWFWTLISVWIGVFRLGPSRTVSHFPLKPNGLINSNLISIKSNSTFKQAQQRQSGEGGLAALCGQSGPLLPTELSGRQRVVDVGRQRLRLRVGRTHLRLRMSSSAGLVHVSCSLLFCSDFYCPTRLHWLFLLGWKLSPVVFYHWLVLRNTTWLSFQANDWLVDHFQIRLINDWLTIISPWIQVLEMVTEVFGWCTAAKWNEPISNWYLNPRRFHRRCHVLGVTNEFNQCVWMMIGWWPVN